MSQVISRNQASNAYPRLEFDQFDARPKPPEPEPVVEDVAPGVEEGPLEIAPGIQLPTLEDIERIQQDAHSEGYAAGYEEGRARGHLEATELHQLVQKLDKALGTFDQEVAEELQALAIELARQVVRDTLAAKPEALLAVVREALLHLPQASAVIRVNPADIEMLKHYLAEHYDNIKHRVVEDTGVRQGGCLIESEGAVLDAQVQTRWRRVIESFSPSAAQFTDE